MKYPPFSVWNSFVTLIIDYLAWIVWVSEIKICIQITNKIASYSPAVMRKRKIGESATPPASSQEFTSLISKYSFPAANFHDLDSKPPSTPVTLPKAPQPKSKKTCPIPRSSPGKSRNPGYAPPSTYSHLPIPDLDCLDHNLILVFIGLNPG